MQRRIANLRRAWAENLPRDGMHMGTYWDGDVGEYIEPGDERWNVERYRLITQDVTAQSSDFSPRRRPTEQKPAPSSAPPPAAPKQPVEPDTDAVVAPKGPKRKAPKKAPTKAKKTKKTKYQR